MSESSTRRTSLKRKGPDPAVRAALKPFSNAYLEIFRMVQDASDEDLALLDGKVETFTSTNCGWYEYAAIRAIAADVEHERRRRSEAGT